MLLQCVPINIGHEEIANFLKINFHIILFQAYRLVCIGPKSKNIHQCKPEISLIL